MIRRDAHLGPTKVTPKLLMHVIVLVLGIFIALGIVTMRRLGALQRMGSRESRYSETVRTPP